MISNWTNVIGGKECRKFYEYAWLIYEDTAKLRCLTSCNWSAIRNWNFVTKVAFFFNILTIPRKTNMPCKVQVMKKPDQQQNFSLKKRNKIWFSQLWNCESGTNCYLTPQELLLAILWFLSTSFFLPLHSLST